MLSAVTGEATPTTDDSPEQELPQASKGSVAQNIAGEQEDAPTSQQELFAAIGGKVREIQLVLERIDSRKADTSGEDSETPAIASGGVPSAEDLKSKTPPKTPSSKDGECADASPQVPTNQPAASSQQPTASSQQPTASSQQPTASSQQPTASSQQPTASSQQPMEPGPATAANVHASTTGVERSFAENTSNGSRALPATMAGSSTSQASPQSDRELGSKRELASASGERSDSASTGEIEKEGNELQTLKRLVGELQVLVAKLEEMQPMAESGMASDWMNSPSVPSMPWGFGEPEGSVLANTPVQTPLDLDASDDTEAEDQEEDEGTMLAEEQEAMEALSQLSMASTQSDRTQMV